MNQNFIIREVILDRRKTNVQIGSCFLTLRRFHDVISGLDDVKFDHQEVLNSPFGTNIECLVCSLYLRCILDRSCSRIICRIVFTISTVSFMNYDFITGEFPDS